jgi:hypothetical protein
MESGNNCELSFSGKSINENWIFSSKNSFQIVVLQKKFIHKMKKKPKELNVIMREVST